MGQGFLLLLDFGFGPHADLSSREQSP